MNVVYKIYSILYTNCMYAWVCAFSLYACFFFYVIIIIAYMPDNVNHSCLLLSDPILLSIFFSLPHFVGFQLRVDLLTLKWVQINTTTAATRVRPFRFVYLFKPERSSLYDNKNAGYIFWLIKCSIIFYVTASFRGTCELFMWISQIFSPRQFVCVAVYYACLRHIYITIFFPGFLLWI